MDRVTHCHRLKTVLPRLLLAGVLGVSAGCAHDQGVEQGAHHQDMGHDAHDMAGHHAAGHPSNDAIPTAKAVGAERLAEELGIELVTLHTTGGGGMLDLRYKVVDADKAYAVVRESSTVNIVVVDHDNDVIAHVPPDHRGWFRSKSGKAHTDQLYFVIFANPHGKIRPGAKVDIHVGDVAVLGWPVL